MRIAQSPTAIDAFHAHNSQSGQQRTRILQFIERNPDLDWSIGEVAHFLSLEKSTVSARINELLATGELEARAPRKDRRSGITVRPVGLPVVGQVELF